MPPQDRFYDRFRKISEAQKVLDRLYEMKGTLSRAAFEYEEALGIYGGFGQHYLNQRGEYTKAFKDTSNLPEGHNGAVERTLQDLNIKKSGWEMASIIDEDLGAIRVRKSRLEFSLDLIKTPTEQQWEALKTLEEAAKLQDKAFYFSVLDRQVPWKSLKVLGKGTSLRELKELLPEKPSRVPVFHEIELKPRTKELGIVPYKPNNLQIQRKTTALKDIGEWRKSEARSNAQAARTTTTSGKAAKKAILETENIRVVARVSSS